MKQNQPQLILGGSHKDDRGQLDFYNNLDMSAIKRIYFTTHFSEETIRAWQGHKIESRWFNCVKGSFTVKLIGIDNWENPSANLEINTYTLNENTQQILYIPKGFVNGFRANEANSKLMIMSNYGFQEIEDDQVRFDQNKWATW